MVIEIQSVLYPYHVVWDEEVVLLCRRMEETRGQRFGRTPRTSRDFLTNALSPPPAMAISRAVSSLIDLGCLELVPQPAGAGMEDQEGGPPPPERLTRLGWQLSKLPLHPKLGKMLVFASLFGVLHPVATCAATSEGKDVFETPFDPNRRRMSDAARRQLASSMGGYSDDLAALAAVQSYQADRNDACRRYFLSRGSCEGAPRRGA